MFVVLSYKCACLCRAGLNVSGLLGLPIICPDAPSHDDDDDDDVQMMAMRLMKIDVLVSDVVKIVAIHPLFALLIILVLF